jgi:26S proteasome regulatory subunit N8
VEHLLRDISSSSSAPATSLLTAQSLSTRVNAQIQSLAGLSARLDDIGEYLVKVQKGEMPINYQVVYMLQEIVGLLPQLGNDGEVGKAFRVEVNDGSLVNYLSSMIRTVLAMHDLSGSLFLSFAPFSLSMLRRR